MSATIFSKICPLDKKPVGNHTPSEIETCKRIISFFNSIVISEIEVSNNE